MATGILKAGVQYGDWEGTASADNADQRDMARWLREKGKLSDNEFLVGIDFYSGENHNGKVSAPFVAAIVAEGSNTADNVALQLQGQDPVQVIKRSVELSNEEFLGLFKRFNVVLTWKEFDLTGREYEAPEE